MLRHLAQAARSLGKAPGFTATAVLTIGLGVGAAHRDFQRGERGPVERAAVSPCRAAGAGLAGPDASRREGQSFLARRFRGSASRSASFRGHGGGMDHQRRGGDGRRGRGAGDGGWGNSELSAHARRADRRGPRFSGRGQHSRARRAGRRRSGYAAADHGDSEPPAVAAALWLRCQGSGPQHRHGRRARRGCGCARAGLRAVVSAAHGAGGRTAAGHLDRGTPGLRERVAAECLPARDRTPEARRSDRAGAGAGEWCCGRSAQAVCLGGDSGVACAARADAGGCGIRGAPGDSGFDGIGDFLAADRVRERGKPPHGARRS